MADERATNVIDVRLGQRVRARRLELGMSQERLAELIGVTFQQVQKYEKGVNRIAASRLYEICIALETTIARLFEGIDRRSSALSRAPGSEHIVEAVLATPEGAQLLALFARIKSVRERRRILDIRRVAYSED